jgi:hypothetical protein
MNNIFIFMYKSILFVSVIFLILSFFLSGHGQVGSLIAGYSSLILSIIMIIIMLVTISYKVVKDAGILSTMKTIFTSIGSPLLILAILGFSLYLVITYYNIIVNDRVANGYYVFSYITTFLILLVSYLLYSNINSPEFEKSGRLPSTQNAFAYLISLVALSSTMIVSTILRYFTTDG